MNVGDILNEISMFKKIYGENAFFHILLTVFLEINNLSKHGLYH